MKNVNHLERSSRLRSARAILAVALSCAMGLPPAHAEGPANVEGSANIGGTPDAGGPAGAKGPADAGGSPDAKTPAGASAPAKEVKAAWGQNGLPEVPRNPRPNEVFENITAPNGGKVFFARTKDATTGYPDVRAIDVKTGENLSGKILSNGTIEWTSNGRPFVQVNETTGTETLAFEKQAETAPTLAKKTGRVIKRVVRGKDRGYTVVKPKPADAKPTKISKTGKAVREFFGLKSAEPLGRSPWTKNQEVPDIAGPKKGLKVFSRGTLNADGRPELRAFNTETGELWHGVQAKNNKVTWTSQGFRGPGADPNATPSATVTQRPSDLKGLLKWTDAQTKAAGEKFREIGSKTSTFFERYNPAEDGRITTADTVRGMNKAETATLSFVAALGGAAAINVALHPELNPIAIDQAYGTLTDEISWLSMGGYVMTSNFIINSRGFNTAAPVMQAPLYGIALAIGTMTSIAIMEFANDPDVKACISADNYHKTGNPWDNSREFPARTRDYDACNRAFSKPHLREIASRIFVEKFMPTAAAMIVSGSAFYTAMYAGGKLFKSMQIFGGLTTALASANPVGIGLRMGLNIVLSTYFMSQIDKPMNWSAKRWTRWRLASLAESPGTYGENIEHAEHDLLDSWERIKKNGWVDPSNLADVKDVCYDAKRVGSKYYDCANKSSPDFEGSLVAYHNLQTKWREKMLEPTRQIYQQWVEKVQEYQQLYAYTKDFYHRAIEKIVFTMRNPQAPVTDPRVFSLENMGVNAHSSWIPDGWRSLIYKMTFIYSFDGDFEYVETPSLPEKLIATLACGTEAEGTPEPGFVDKASRFVHRFIIGDASPVTMLENSKGRKVVFSPPRITTPLPDQGSVCGWSGVTSRIKKATVANLPVKIGDKSYVGLPAYIIDNVRNTIITPEGYSRMDAWWQDFVASRDTELNAQLAKEYQAVVDNVFKPALLNTTYYACETRPASVGTALQDYLYRLGAPAETCGAAQMRRLATGVVTNLRDQARLYAAMMMDLYVSSHAHDKGEATTLLNQVLVPARNLLATYDRFVVEYTKLSGTNDTKRMNESLTELAGAFQTFHAAVTKDSTPPAARVRSVEFDTEAKQAKVDDGSGPRNEWMTALTGDLNETLATLTAYVQLASLPKATGK